MSSDQKTTKRSRQTPDAGQAEPAGKSPSAPASDGTTVEEIGGRKGPDPTRYGDWEKDGRCVDF